MAKLVISNSALVDEFFSDAHVLGIQCTAEAHRFVWLVNRHFAFQFTYVQGGEIFMARKGRKFYFPIFQYNEQLINVQHLLYTAKCDGEFLLPELKHTDFLWVMKGDGQAANLIKLVEAELRKLDAVQLVTYLPNHKIKNKEQLIL